MQDGSDPKTDDAANCLYHRRDEHMKEDEVRSTVIGVDVKVPLLDGRRVTYINFDNAASTPAFRQVLEAVAGLLDWYSGVHRGTGCKSRVSTKAYERAREIMLQFVGADPTSHILMFCRNTTEAVNKLSRHLSFKTGDIVLTTLMEHHSNDLPWRLRSKLIHVGVDDRGVLDEDEFDRLLALNGGRVRLVALSGASNVTGIMNPVGRLAQKAHEAGALVFVDAAQLAAHRPIKIGSLNDPSHIDFLALSAHKMYAPFGSGALVARRDLFDLGTPTEVGGGTVKIVTTTSVEWADLPDREEAGSPNTIGAVALGTAALILKEIGMDWICDHEKNLTRYALDQIGKIPGTRLFGPVDTEDQTDRIGVFSFEVEGVPHDKVAAILAYEGGIGVRNGCFCAHPYVVRLLNLTEREKQRYQQDLRTGDHRRIPGLVRVSFGCYNTRAEVDSLVEILDKIARGEWIGDYQQDLNTGEYFPKGVTPIPEGAFVLGSSFRPPIARGANGP